MNQALQTAIADELSIEALAEALYDISEMRTHEDVEKVVELLIEAPYFKSLFSDLKDRKEFLSAASPFFNYIYYAKGATICHQGDFTPNFGIILKGKALVFGPKTKEELDKESCSSLRMQCFERYKQYAKQNGVFRQLRRLQTSHSSYCSQNSLSRPKTLVNLDNFNASLLDLDFIDPIEEITNPQSSLIPTDIARGDLSIDDRFLLLSYGEGIKNYFRDGISTHKKIKELIKGDKIAETAFTINQPSEYTLIASEDLHVLSIKKECFQALAAQSLPCFKKKRQFLSMVFPKLSYETILQLSIYVEEKTFSSWEYIYKEGQDSEAIYIIKSGQVQLMKISKEKIQEGSIILKESSKPSSSKNQLIIGGVDIGGVFGEEEVVRKTKRKYSAKSNNSSTLLYVIQREFYTNTLLAYYPDVARAIKSMMYTRSSWRKEREKFSQRVATEILQSQELGKSEILTAKIEDMPSEFIKNFSLLLSKTPSNPSNPSYTCEERISRMTKRTIEIGVKNLKQPNQDPTKIMCSPTAGGFTSACATALENQKTRLWKRNQTQTVIFTNKTKSFKCVQSPKTLLEKTPKATPNSSPNKSNNYLPKTYSKPIASEKLTLRLSKSLCTSVQLDKILEANRENQRCTTPVANSKNAEVLQRHCSVASTNPPYLDLVKRESTPVPAAVEISTSHKNSWVGHILSAKSQNSDTPIASLSSKSVKSGGRRFVFPDENSRDFTPKAIKSINSWAESSNYNSTPKHGGQASLNSLTSETAPGKVFVINKGAQGEPVFVKVKAQTPKASQTLFNPSQFRKFSKHDNAIPNGNLIRKISCQI